MDFLVTDRATASMTKRSMTEQGYMLVKDCALARAGVIEYAAANFQPRMYNDRDPNDVIRVYRSADTLAASLPAWAGAPFTDEHPASFLNADNTGLYQKGHILGTPRMQGELMIADIIVTDGRVREAIEAGKQELSNGYTSGYDFTPGVSPSGEPYDAEQLALRPNHVALVAAGRCGSMCRVSDSADVTIQEKPTMATVTVNGVTYEATEQLIQVINGLQAQVADLLAKSAAAPEEAQAAVAEATAQVEEATAQVAELTSQLEQATSPDALDAAVEERTAVMDAARKVIPNFDGKGKSNAAIRAEVVKTKFPELKNTDNADFVRGRFEALAEAAPATKPNALNSQLAASIQNRDSQEGDFPNVDAAREKAIARRREMYKGGKK